MSNRSISPFERYGEAFPLTDATLKTHRWTAADSISLLAEKYLGDWRLWRLIAEKNNITDVRQIEPGMILIIPKQPLEVGQYESA